MTIQLPILQSGPQEMETTPSGGRSMVQTGDPGQFDGNRGTLVSLNVGKTQQETPWNSTHDWWGGGRSTSIIHPWNKLDAEKDEDLENVAND